MKILKRSQLAMLSISFMIMIAGYINYKYDPKREENLGKTMKVDSDEVYVYTSGDNVDIYKETNSAINKNDTIYNSKSLNTISSYIASRDNMFSELEEKYESVISQNVNSEEVKLYQEKLDELIKKKHLIEVVEGILKAKGITNIAIVPNEDKYNVIVSLDEKLTDAQVNLIEQIIKEEFNVETSNIKIIEQ